MFEDRKAYLRDVTHNVTVCRNKLDLVLKKIGWTQHSLQKQALVDMKNETEELGFVEDIEVEPEQNMGDTNHCLMINCGISFETCHSLPGNSTKTYNELVESIANQSKLKTKKKKETELLVEMLAMERDSKRRRTSYKHKVHTKNKSHTEILREVLEQQMEYLKGNESSEKPIHDAQINQKLIEIGQIDCVNPYLVWKNIDKYVQNEDKREHKRRKSRSHDRKRHRSRSKHKKEYKHRSESRSRKRHKSSHSKKHSHNV